MKKSNKVYKFNSDLDKAYRQLFGPSNPAGCSVCGDDAIDDLGIYRQDGSNREWQILYRVYNIPAKDTITREGAMS